MKNRILIVDDDLDIRRILAMQLEDAGYGVSLAENGQEGLKGYRQEKPELLLTDLRMPCGDGGTLLKSVLQEDQEATVVVMTAYPTVETAVEIMKAGAFDFMVKPFKGEQLLATVERAMKVATLKRENRRLRQAAAEFHDEETGSASPVVNRVYRQAMEVADTDTTILVSGETGTGKEHLAKFIHRKSPRAAAPWVVVNCGALPESIVEAELFGHKKGSFTGAESERPGRILSADGGTLFMDEIGDLPLQFQVKVLRFLQEGEIQAIGSDTPVKVDARVIAATNRDLADMIEKEKFREDLYYRLNIIHLELPPLRDRREDIIHLANHFIEEAAGEYGREPSSFSAKALQALESFSWPGNIRQLRNLCKRWALLYPGKEISPDMISSNLAQTGKQEAAQFRLPPEGLNLEKLERDLIEQALKATAGNKSAASRLLGISRHALDYRMEKHAMK